jgi:hypothetical protein
MAERTEFHLWLHGLPSTHLVALRAAKIGQTLSPDQKTLLAQMPAAFVTAATTRKDTSNGNQG